MRLGDYFGKKPIVLSLVYFNCPFMCTEVLNGELRAMQGISLKLGKDYDAVTVSFDPKDGPPQAALKNRIYTGLYGRPVASGGWHFLTGEPRFHPGADRRRRLRVRLRSAQRTVCSRHRHHDSDA